MKTNYFKQYYYFALNYYIIICFCMKCKSCIQKNNFQLYQKTIYF